MSNDNLEEARRFVKWLNDGIACGCDILIEPVGEDNCFRPVAFYVGSPETPMPPVGVPLHFPVFAVIGNGINGIRPAPVCIDRMEMGVFFTYRLSTFKPSDETGNNDGDNRNHNCKL